MKKRKGIKVFIIIAFVFILLGSIFIGAGLMKGGSLKYLSISKETASWWPFEHGSMGINFDIFDEDISVSTKNYEETLDSVKSVFIDADAADITIRRGTQNKLIYKIRKKEYLSIRNNHGDLNIQVDHHNHLHNMNTKIILELRDDVYDSIIVDSKMGDVLIEDVHAKAMNVNMKLGDVELKNIVSQSLNVDQKCGDIDVEGVLLNKTTISNKLGETQVYVRGNKNDYRYEVKNTMGDSEILGMEHEFSTDISSGNAAAHNLIQIDNKLGDIELDIR